MPSRKAPLAGFAGLEASALMISSSSIGPGSRGDCGTQDGVNRGGVESPTGDCREARVVEVLVGIIFTDPFGGAALRACLAGSPDGSLCGVLGGGVQGRVVGIEAVIEPVGCEGIHTGLVSNVLARCDAGVAGSIHASPTIHSCENSAGLTVGLYRAVDRLSLAITVNRRSSASPR